MNKSIRLSVESLEGRALMSATLATPTPETAYYTIKLQDVLVSSYQPSASEVPAATDEISSANGDEAIGLLLPAVQKIRQAAARMNCSTAATDDRPQESMSLNFTKISYPTPTPPATTDTADWDYFLGVPEDDATEGGQKTAGYDLATLKKV